MSNSLYHIKIEMKLIPDTVADNTHLSSLKDSNS